MPSLGALLGTDVDIAAVVTTPDRPAGRGMAVRPSPVKEAAVAEGLTVIQPETARDQSLDARLRDIAPDAAVVVAYGRILPASLLAIPARGFVNVHFSLLPAYRGAAPVQRAIINGDKVTGVSIMVLTEGMDEGPVLARRELAIGPDDSAGKIGEKLAVEGAELLVEVLDGYVHGAREPVPQDDAAATYAPKITIEEARIDWSLPSVRVRDLVRGLDPVPGAWTTEGDRRLKVFRVRPTEVEPVEPGRVIEGESLLVGTGDRPVELAEVQLAGKRRMTGNELVRGLRLGTDAVLGMEPG